MSSDPNEPRSRDAAPAVAPRAREAAPPGSRLPSDEDASNETRDRVMDRHMAELIGELVHKQTRSRGEPSSTRLGGYRVLRRLGAGGMGEVFTARHVETGEEIALKTLSSTSATRLYRFKREFRALADVSHRNLVRLHELVVPEGGPAFFTMELLDGLPFVEWVRGSAPDRASLPERERLEHALRQLVEGVHHLHAHGCIHRDLKPSNVLVTSEGRVVVLDFGLVSDLSEPEQGITRDRQILGTPGYMAPEQALGRSVGPAADWYAVGVMLYECLTGHLPHEGPALTQMLAKQDATPDPGDDAPGAPEHLRALCLRLLARDPDARPSGRELLERLRASSTPTAVPGEVFVGRTDELAVLRAALRAVVERDEPVVLHLRGRSGDGKSALVRRFRAELRATEAVVLHGRCREREAVPYKGVDAIVDALSAHLRRLSEAERTALQPPDLDVLVQMFPVLDEIWPRAATQKLGLTEVRKLGGVTLRKLLERVAGRRPLLVHIDDVQWADLDSVRLLQELLRPPAAPRMLLVLSYRSEVDGSEALRELMASEILAGSRARSIELGPLSAADARELAASLLRVGGEIEPPGRGRAEAIALRSRGSPFFIAQMALGGEPEASESDLDQLIVRRVAGLDDDAQRLLEVVAVFGGPLSAGFALDLCTHASAATITALCELGLLVRDEDRRGEPDERIEAAHDLVREVVLAGLDADERIELHRRIGARLLACRDDASRAEWIFAAVNHLDAAMGDVDALSTDRRLELAKLNCSAGECALESAAWIAAHRYLSCAHQLAAPWLAEAREGHGQRELCTAIVFGRIQAEIALGLPEGDAAIDELVDWSLPVADYCRIAQWYCESLTLRAQFSRSVEFGTRALARIGFRAPARPSWLRALVSYLRGWRAIWKIGLDRIQALPPITDERIRTGMAIIAITGAAAVSVDVKLQLTLSGIYGRLLTRHGFHDETCVALSGLALSAAFLGKNAEAKALCELVERLIQRPGGSSAAQQLSQAFLLFALLMFHPAREVVAAAERAHRRARDVSPRAQVEMIWNVHILFHFFAGAPLAKAPSVPESLAEHDSGFILPFMRDFVVAFERYVGTLVEGQPTTTITRDLGPEILENQRCLLAVMRLETEVLLGEHERAWASVEELDRGYERKLGPIGYVPVYAVLSVVVMAGRWPSSSRGERRRMRRMIRRRRATAHRWVDRCRENYQPMLDIIDAEVAALAERHDEALAAYERARAIASANEMLWLAGLASERLAQLARRRGQPLLSTAALDAARAAYEGWGAIAVVRRLHREHALDDDRGSPGAASTEA